MYVYDDGCITYHHPLRQAQWWIRIRIVSLYFYFFLIAIASMTKLIIIFETFDSSAFVYTIIIITPRTSSIVATVRCSEAIMTLYSIIIILLHARRAVYIYYYYFFDWRISVCGPWRFNRILSLDHTVIVPSVSSFS